MLRVLVPTFEAEIEVVIGVEEEVEVKDKEGEVGIWDFAGICLE